LDGLSIATALPRCIAEPPQIEIQLFFSSPTLEQFGLPIALLCG
jgi:hypothetical protein